MTPITKGSAGARPTAPRYRRTTPYAAYHLKGQKWAQQQAALERSDPHTELAWWQPQQCPDPPWPPELDPPTQRRLKRYMDRLRQYIGMLPVGLFPVIPRTQAVPLCSLERPKAPLRTAPISTVPHRIWALCDFWRAVCLGATHPHGHWDPRRAHALIQGYQSIRPLTPAEIQHQPILLAISTLYAWAHHPAPTPAVNRRYRQIFQGLIYPRPRKRRKKRAVPAPVPPRRMSRPPDPEPWYAPRSLFSSENHGIRSQQGH